jgi:hypothetical protein
VYHQAWLYKGSQKINFLDMKMWMLGAGGLAEVVEHLICKWEVLSSNPGITK